MADKKRLLSLTSLRFFAAAAVVVHHFNPHIGRYKVEAFALGAHGVSFFFVLSGFILIYVYPKLGNWDEIKRFWLARFARIWPVHALTTFIALWVLWAHYGRDAGFLFWHGLPSLAMVQTWFPLNHYNYSINGPSWSIATETFFYLMFPLLILGFQFNWAWKLAGALAVAIVLVLIATAANMPWHDPNRLADAQTLLYMFPVGRLFEFVAGMCAGLLWFRLRSRCSGGKVLWTGAEIAVVAAVLATSYGIQHLSVNAPWRFWFGSSSMAIPAAGLFFVFAANRGVISGA